MPFIQRRCGNCHAELQTARLVFTRMDERSILMFLDICTPKGRLHNIALKRGLLLPDHILHIIQSCIYEDKLNPANEYLLVHRWEETTYK